MKKIFLKISKIIDKIYHEIYEKGFFYLNLESDDRKLLRLLKKYKISELSFREVDNNYKIFYKEKDITPDIKDVKESLETLIKFEFINL